MILFFSTTEFCGEPSKVSSKFTWLDEHITYARMIFDVSQELHAVLQNTDSVLFCFVGTTEFHGEPSSVL